MKLVVGAGDRRMAGFKHHDVLPLDDLDYQCDFWDLPEHVPMGEIEEIHITHVLEHFPMKETAGTFKLLYDMLKTGGKVYIEVPNFKWHAEMILKDPTDRQIVEYAFGGQKDDYDYHYMGFTPEILEEELLDAGFNILSLVPNSSIECWVEK